MKQIEAKNVTKFACHVPRPPAEMGAAGRVRVAAAAVAFGSWRFVPRGPTLLQRSRLLVRGAKGAGQCDYRGSER